MPGKTSTALLHDDVGALAGKTGFTKAAGRTLATYFEREQKQIIVVTLNASNDWNFHRELANQIDGAYDIVTVAEKGKYESNGVKLFLREPINLLLKRSEVDELRHVVHVSRNTASKRAVWHVMLNNKVLTARRVEKN